MGTLTPPMQPVKRDYGTFYVPVLTLQDFIDSRETLEFHLERYNKGFYQKNIDFEILVEEYNFLLVQERLNAISEYICYSKGLSLEEMKEEYYKTLYPDRHTLMSMCLLILVISTTG